MRKIKIIIMMLTMTIILFIIICGCRKNLEGGVTEPLNTFDQLSNEEQLEELKRILEEDKYLNIKLADVWNISKADGGIVLGESDIESNSKEYLNHYRYKSVVNVTFDDDWIDSLNVWITPTGKITTDYVVVKNREKITEIFEEELNFDDIDYAFFVETKVNEPLKNGNKSNLNKTELKELLGENGIDNYIRLIVNTSDENKVWEIIEKSDLTFTSGAIHVYYTDESNLSDALYDVDNLESDTHSFVKGL